MMKAFFHLKKPVAATARKPVMLRLNRAGTCFLYLVALPTKVCLPHRRSPNNSSRSSSRPKPKTTASCYQTLKITSMPGPLTCKKHSVARRSSSWSSLCTFLDPFHRQFLSKVQTKSLTTRGWRVATSSPMIRSA